MTVCLACGRRIRFDGVAWVTVEDVPVPICFGPSLDAMHVPEEDRPWED